MAENIYRVKFPQNRQNWALICSAERLSCASMKIDVIEEWRHWRAQRQHWHSPSVTTVTVSRWLPCDQLWHGIMQWRIKWQ